MVTRGSTFTSTPSSTNPYWGSNPPSQYPLSLLSHGAGPQVDEPKLLHACAALAPRRAAAKTPATITIFCMSLPSFAMRRTHAAITCSAGLHLFARSAPDCAEEFAPGSAL